MMAGAGSHRAHAEAVVRMRHVTKVYGTGQVALSDVNFRMGPGEFIVLTGPTGSGKSTLIRLVLMQEPPTSGEVLVSGMVAGKATPGQVAKLRRQVGVVPQEPVVLPDRDVYENVALAYRIQARQRGEASRRVMHALTRLGIAHRRNARPHQLSGGEQQLVAVARAIVSSPWLIIADEPLAGLDRTSALRVVTLLHAVNIQGSAILVAAHRAEPWRWSGARVVRIEAGRVRGVESSDD